MIAVRPLKAMKRAFSSSRTTRMKIGEPMVAWLSPTGLMYTGINVLLSGVFSRFADKRELVAAVPAAPIRYNVPGDLWIDYIADTGDGWSSTCAVAWAACQEHDVGGESTKPGLILVLGGDQVYPSADFTQYDRRLQQPFALASQQLEAGPRDVLAIPGNHDWLDGLTAFMRVFSDGQKMARTWAAPQKRSYFAAQLRTNWWLLGIDIGFDDYLDAGQLRFFEEECHAAINGRIGQGDHIILCTGKPTWAERRLAGDIRIRKHSDSTLLEEFERRIVKDWGCDLALVLSGDLHHYARYRENENRRQRITAGGGGAFLFPTHGLAPTIEWPDPSGQGVEKAVRACTYPDVPTSEGLRGRIALGPLKTPSFLLLMAGIHVAIASQVRGAVQTTGVSSIQSLVGVSWGKLFGAIFTRPLAGLIAILLLLGLLAFFDADGPGNRLTVASLHWLIQLATVALSMYVAVWTSTHLLAIPPTGGVGTLLTIKAFVAMAVITATVGALLGSLIFGCYLYLCVRAGRHANDAFAAIHLDSYKSFVRLKLDERGGLSLYAFKIPQVPKRPMARTILEHGLASTFQDVEVGLIEGPIIVREPAIQGEG